MRQLEDRLGIRLLNRTTRSVSLTDAGVRLLERVRPAIEQIAGALEDLNLERDRPVGRLRIHVIHTAAWAVIAPIWVRFLSTYPEVHLEVQVSEAPVDIVAKGFDAGIGPHDRAAGDMITVRVMVNTPDLAVRGAVDGLGITYTIEALAVPFLRSGQLVRVLEEWSSSFEGLFLYYPGHRQVPAALRAFIDMVRPAHIQAPTGSSLENPFTVD